MCWFDWVQVDYFLIFVKNYEVDNYFYRVQLANVATSCTRGDFGWKFPISSCYNNSDKLSNVAVESIVQGKQRRQL